MKVLLIERSSCIRSLITIAINNSGCEFLGECDSYQDAIVAIKCQVPDCLVFDITLSARLGADFLKLLRNAFPRMRIIVFINFVVGKIKQRFINIGADYVLDKYSEFDQLEGILNNLRCPA